MTNKQTSFLIFSNLCLLAVVTLSTLSASAQGRYVNTYSKNTVKGYIDRLEKSSNTFRRDFDRYMDRSNLNGTDTEDRYNDMVADYEDALDRLRSDFNRRNNWWESRSDVQEMLSRAEPVNSMVNGLPFGRNIESQWRNMRNDINKVADTYDLPGLNGGGWNGGGWNGGNNGNSSRPPNWAQGTFYSTNITGYTMTISRDGQVTLEGPNGTFNGRWNQNTIYINNEVYPATQSGNGIRAYNSSTRTYTNYSRSGGGYNDGGNSDTPPNWAVGTFYSTNITGYTMTINRAGQVTLDGPNGTTSGRWNQNTIYIGNEVYPTTQSGDGMRAYNRSTRTYTNYSRSGGGYNDGGNSDTPPNWAVGTFYSQNIPGYTMTVYRDGNVTISGPNGTTSGRWNRNSIIIAGQQFPASRINGGISAMNNSTGIETIYMRR